MPGADYGPLSQGSRHDVRAISPITQPQDSRGAAPAHTPGRAEPPTQPAPRSSPRVALGRPSPRAKTRLPLTSNRVCPALHAPLTGPPSVPPVLGRRPVPPGNIYVSIHPQSKHAGPETHPSWAPAPSLRWCDLSFGSGLTALHRSAEKRDANASEGREEGAAGGRSVSVSLATPPKPECARALPPETRLLPGGSANSPDPCVCVSGHCQRPISFQIVKINLES